MRNVIPLAGPFLAACALLVVAGVGKAVYPAPLVRALRSVGLRVPAPAVRLVATGEAALGAVAALTGSRPAAALVAASYLAFTGFVLVALRRGGVLASCGCFGRQDTPPTRTHAALTGVLALAAASVAVRPLGDLASVLGRTPGAGLALVVTTATLAAVLYLALAVLPLLRAARPVAAR